MGYLIKIKYHPKKNDEGFGFDLETTEEKELKLGQIGDDVDHSQLAMTILKQLSRRDIYVYDVEVIEFVKKTLKVRESKNGIIIGQKKYTFNEVQDLNHVMVQEEGAPAEVSFKFSDSQPNPTPQRSVQPAPPPIPAQKPTVIRKEYFDPSMPNPEAYAEQFAAMGLTIGKQYEIIKEEGTRYTVINDSGKTTNAPLQHFNAVKPGQANLIERPEAKIPGENSLEEIPLSYGSGEIRGPMMNIR